MTILRDISHVISSELLNMNVERKDTDKAVMEFLHSLVDSREENSVKTFLSKVKSSYFAEESLYRIFFSRINK